MNSRILKLIEERLLLGERKYGHQNIKSDGRDFELEALEEILDGMVYISARIIEVMDKRLINIIKEKEDGHKNNYGK
tara:strand:- start:13183 stop:13413 length:231 start_codon:yes stop_codon:yes gene_type:complete